MKQRDFVHTRSSFMGTHCIAYEFLSIGVKYGAYCITFMTQLFN